MMNLLFSSFLLRRFFAEPQNDRSRKGDRELAASGKFAGPSPQASATDCLCSLGLPTERSRLSTFASFMKALLLAAGLGTRLKPFTDKHPKALATVNGRTLLEWNIRYLQRFGIEDVIVNVHHFANQIEETVHKNEGFGSRVTISDERDAVLETGGGLLKAAPFFDGEEAFVVMNVDALTNLDLAVMLEHHRRCSPVATLAVQQRETSRFLLFDESLRLCGWRNIGPPIVERTARVCKEPKGFGFVGVQVLTPAFLQSIRRTGKFSIIDAYMDAAPEHEVLGYDCTEALFIDVGKPESLARAASLFPAS